MNPEEEIFKLQEEARKAIRRAKEIAIENNIEFDYLVAARHSPDDVDTDNEILEGAMEWQASTVHCSMRSEFEDDFGYPTKYWNEDKNEWQDKPTWEK